MEEITKQQIENRKQQLETPNFKGGTFGELQELLKDTLEKIIQLEERIEKIENAN